MYKFCTANNLLNDYGPPSGAPAMHIDLRTLADVLGEAADASARVNAVRRLLEDATETSGQTFTAMVEQLVNARDQYRAQRAEAIHAQNSLAAERDVARRDRECLAKEVAALDVQLRDANASRDVLRSRLEEAEGRMCKAHRYVVKDRHLACESCGHVYQE